MKERKKRVRKERRKERIIAATYSVCVTSLSILQTVVKCATHSPAWRRAAHSTAWAWGVSTHWGWCGCVVWVCMMWVKFVKCVDGVSEYDVCEVGDDGCADVC